MTDNHNIMINEMNISIINPHIFNNLNFNEISFKIMKKHIKDLKKIFVFYSSIGENLNIFKMKVSKFKRLLSEAGLFERGLLTIVDVDLIFSK